MIKQFLKILWNNRRRNILVFIELFMISLVLTNLTIYLVNMFEIYRIKTCYDTSDVILIQIRKKSSEEKGITENSFNNLKKVITSNPFVESVSFCNNATPFMYNSWMDQLDHDSVKIGIGTRFTDIDYGKVMKIQPVKGRWFDETDFGKEVGPILISRDIDEEYFNGKSIGARVKMHNKEYEIIGVTERYKRSDIETPEKFAFFLKDSISSRRYWGDVNILIRTKENMTSEMLNVAQSQVYSTINKDNWTMLGLNSLENMHTSQNVESYQRNYLTVIIAIFIIVNILLGTVGILWYNTNLRYHEIGIRRAIGATGKKIRQHLIGESILLAITGLLIVILIVAQLPVIFGSGKTEPGVIAKSLIISTILMLILVFLSTWIPASLASKIHPATALKTE
jgi:putative ABC transport system permease protein